MFKNHVKIALRNFVRYKLYSFINIAGLAIGIAACLMIYLWVQNELSYDRFHQNSGRIYRIERKVDFRDMHGRAPNTSGPFGPALVRDYPEIENFVRLDFDEFAVKDQNNIFRKQSLLFTDNSLFEVFDFDLETGDPKTALNQPDSLVLTREMALKYLDTEDALGMSLTVDWHGTVMDFLITGILEDVPNNSHVQFDVAASLSTYPEENLSSWFNNTLYTYLLLKTGTSIENLENKLSAFLTKYMAADFLAIVGPETDIHDVFQMKMNPLLNIHLHPSEQFEIQTQGSKTSVYIFSVIALLILIIACINFMNLSTARAKKRAREVGLRKTVGAGKSQLWLQFLGESVFLSFISLVLAILLILVFLPVFNSITNKALSISLLFQFGSWFVLLGITLATGVLAGLYPAFYLSAFEPARVLKSGALSGNGKSAFRRVMAVAQFVISITLIIGTLVIFKQMEFIRNKSLGFDKENVVILQADGKQISQNIETFRTKLNEYTGIKSVTISSSVPGGFGFYDTAFKRDDTDDVFSLVFISTDYDFVDTFGFELIEGRNFSREFGTDIQGAIILNEAAVKEIGLTPEEAVGKKLNRFVDIDKFREGNIVGIVKDFNFRSLHQVIEPCVLILNPKDFYLITARILPGDVRKTMSFIQQKWGETFPGEEFEYSFLDSRIDLLYEKEGKMRNLFLFFSILSIFVASLGLFGLASFAAEERTKEIGVRKVLGASTVNIFLLLCKEFARWVLLANLVAWPVAYYVMIRWLQNFAYKVNVGLWPFVLSAAVALMIALLTVSFQAIKASLTEPVISLRYE